MTFRSHSTSSRAEPVEIMTGTDGVSERLSEHRTDSHSSSGISAENSPTPASTTRRTLLPPDPAIDKRFIDFFQKREKGRSLAKADPEGILLRSAACANRPALVELLVTQAESLEKSDPDGHTALATAAGGGQTAVVSTLLRLGDNASAKDRQGRTPLWWAAHNGHADTVRTFVETEKGIEIEGPDASGRTLLIAAAANGHSKALETLLWPEKTQDWLGKRDHLNVDNEDPQGRTALSWAAEGGHAATVHLLLTTGADADIQDVHGWSAVHWAAARGHQPVIRELQASGADFGAADLGGRTPLSWAAGNGHVAAVEAILELQDIDANTQDGTGRTPLSWAAGQGHIQVIKSFLAWALKRESARYERLKRFKRATPLKFALDVGAGSDVATALADNGLEINLPDNEGRTPISWAAGNGQKDVTLVLIRHGAEIDVPDFEERTPFWWAAENGHLSVVDWILEQSGADIDIFRQDHSGETALSRARFRGFDRIVALLERTAPNPSDDSKRLNDYRQLLLWAVQEEYSTAVELILREGADPNARCADGSYLLGWAADTGNVEIARLLIDAGATVDAVEDRYRYPYSGREGTPLFRAATSGHNEMVEYLLTNGADLNWKGILDYTPLTQAVKEGHKNVVATLLRHGADLVFWPRPDDGWTSSWEDAHTPVGLAVNMESPDIAMALIDHAIEILGGRPYGEDQRDWRGHSTSDYPDRVNRTLLSYAVQIGYISGVKRLLAMPHVDVNHDGYHGRRPLTLAAESGDEALVDILLLHNAEFDYTDWEPRAPFATAYEEGHQALAVRLLEMSMAALSEDSWDGETSWNEIVLWWAARIGHLSAVKSLLAKFKSPPDLSTPSQWASAEGHLAVVEYLLAMGAKLTSESTEYHFEDPGILSGAALHGHEAIVRLLLERGADPNGEEAGRADDEGLRPLGRAAQRGHVEIAKLLLQYGADPNLRPTIREKSSSYYAASSDEDKGTRPLTIAADYGHFPMVELLLAHGADPTWGSRFRSWGGDGKRDWRVPDLWSYSGKSCAILHAIRSGHGDIVKALLAAGADVKMNDKNLLLAWAAMEKEPEIADLLIEHGCGFELKDYGETVLSVASRSGNPKVVKIFIEMGADIEGKDKDGRSPLSLAKTTEVAKILINAGADVNSEDNYGRSPLCWATDIEIVKALLDAKANVISGQGTGRTPLITAVKQKYLEKARLLLQAGADVNGRDQNSRTPLLIAIKAKDDYRNQRMVELLLDHGADTEAEDLKGLTALSWAAWNKHMDIVKILVKKGASLASFVGYSPERSSERRSALGRSRRRRRVEGDSNSNSESGTESDPDSPWDEPSDGTRRPLHPGKRRDVVISGPSINIAFGNELMSGT